MTNPSDSDGRDNTPPAKPARKRRSKRPPAPQEKPKCGGKRRGVENAGLLCTRPAGWGTPHPGTGPCKLHGGSTASHRKAAQTALAVAAVNDLGLPREVDPRDALLEEVYRTAGAVDWLHRQVAQLEADDMIWGKTEESVQTGGEFPGTNVVEKAAVNIWVQMWTRERKHLVEVCRIAIAAGLEERRVRLAESQGAMLAGVIKAILGDLDLSPEQSAKVGVVVPRHLRSVAA